MHRTTRRSSRRTIWSLTDLQTISNTILSTDPFSVLFAYAYTSD